MKKIILGAAFLLMTGMVQAEPVFLWPSCTYGPTSGECTLWNTSGKDISCNIRATAQTKNGSYINAYDYRVLYQGMFAWVRVYANDSNDPIVHLSANAFCNTLY